MILVLSYDWYEQGTDPVLDWLIYYKADFVKVTINDLLNKKDECLIDVNKGEIWINGKEVSKHINVIWYRRFEDDIKFSFFNEEKTKFKEQLRREIQEEISGLMKYLFMMFRDKLWLPNYNAIEVNKLEVIYQAKKEQINIPKTIICNNRNNLLKFYYECKCNIITKPIHHSGYFIDNDITFSVYTTSIDKEFILSLPEYFVASLFQERIKAKFEIRTFYLDGDFYSTAIILTSKSQENIDIKQNFGSKEINWIPYKLSEDYEEKMRKLFKRLDLNTGSFDSLLNDNDEYVLLEINPVGQYSAPSNRCNYRIDKKIADWLIKYDKENNNF